MSYRPFKMKASDHNNSPIEKNYGSPAQRGFDFTGGVGSTEKEGGVGSSLLMASPAKGWLKNLWKGAKKVGGAMLNPIGAIKKGLQGGGEDTAAADATTGVAPHGDEMHTGGDATATGGVGDAVAGAVPGAGGAVMPPEKTNQAKTLMAANTQQQDLMEGGVSGGDRQKNPFGGWLGV